MAAAESTAPIADVRTRSKNTSAARPIPWLAPGYPTWSGLARPLTRQRGRPRNHHEREPGEPARAAGQHAPDDPDEDQRRPSGGPGHPGPGHQRIVGPALESRAAPPDRADLRRGQPVQ